jgi:hypothetical protein
VYDEEANSRYIDDLECSVENFAAPVCMYDACVYVHMHMVCMCVGLCE